MQLHYGKTISTGIISHRGNINGPNPDKENHPTYIEQALRSGYGVEIDVWYENGLWGLGHDKPQYQIDVDYLFELTLSSGGAYYREAPRVWIHLKNIGAVQEMSNMNHYNSISSREDSDGTFGRNISNRLNFFWHQEDDVTITNYGIIWAHPKLAVIPVRSAWVVPEKKNYDVYDYTNENWLRAKWVCVDFPKKVAETLETFRKNTWQ